MPRAKTRSLRSIVQRRKLPGLLLIDAQGKLLSWNSVAREILHLPNHREQLLKKIRKVLRNEKKSSVSPKPVDATPCLHVQTIVSSQRGAYALRAFLLDHQPKGRNPIVAVLLEKISLNRMELPNVQRLFGLSPREIEAIQVLLFGKTDKEIASILEVSSETARGYVKAIRAKLGVSTRTAIIHKVMST